MARVRAFTRDDIGAVAALHERVFPAGGTDTREAAAYDAYFRGVFLENPAGSPLLPSLVYEDADARVVGFLGVVRRRFALGDARFEGAVSSQFVVDPSAQPAVVAVRLAKAFLEGPQDLSVADEATDAARRIWEGLGGTTALLNSLYWTRPLRPVRLATSYIRERRLLAPLAVAARPLAAALDAFATRMPGSQFRLDEHGAAEDVDATTVTTYAPQLYDSGTLWVEYDDRTFQWLLDRAGTRRGRLLKAAFRNGLNIIGWYICHLGADGHAEVLQLAATPASIGTVLDHLFYRAWQHGAVAVTGRLEPRFMQVLSDRYCLLHRRGPWMLVKARQPELVSSFHAGTAALSRLDGEWSLRFS